MQQIIKYGISGLSAAAVNIGFLYIFTEWLHIWYLASATISFILGVCVSFTLQKFWTFNNNTLQRMHIQTGLFLMIALGNLILNTGGIYLLVHYVHAWYVLAEFITLGLLAIASFFLYRSLVFTGSSQNHSL